MSLTDRTKPTDVCLNTDLYELTMAQGFWESVGLVRSVSDMVSPNRRW